VPSEIRIPRYQLTHHPGHERCGALAQNTRSPARTLQRWLYEWVVNTQKHEKATRKVTANKITPNRFYSVP